MNRVTQRERDALRMAAQRVVRLDANGNLVGDLYDIAVGLAQQEHVSQGRARQAWPVEQWRNMDWDLWSCPRAKGR